MNAVMGLDSNAVMGLDSITRGNIFVFGKEVKKINPGNMLKNRLALVPESRKTQGLILVTAGFVNSKRIPSKQKPIEDRKSVV